MLLKGAINNLPELRVDLGAVGQGMPSFFCLCHILILIVDLFIAKENKGGDRERYRIPV